MDCYNYVVKLVVQTHHHLTHGPIGLNGHSLVLSASISVIMKELLWLETLIGISQEQIMEVSQRETHKLDQINKKNVFSSPMVLL